MWGYYSSCTGTFFYIQLHSRNANHKLGIPEKKIFITKKTQWKDISRGFTVPQKRGDNCPKRNHSKNSASPTLFSTRISFFMLAYFNIFQHMYGPRVTHFDTLTSGSRYALAHQKRKNFSDWIKKERDSPRSVWNCNVYIFIQWEILCS